MSLSSHLRVLIIQASGRAGTLFLPFAGSTLLLPSQGHDMAAGSLAIASASRGKGTDVQGTEVVLPVEAYLLKEPSLELYPVKSVRACGT